MGFQITCLLEILMLLNKCSQSDKQISDSDKSLLTGKFMEVILHSLLKFT